MIAATGWRLEELRLYNNRLGAAGLAPLLAAPTFALRRLGLGYCGLDADALLALASSPWPLEELDLGGNDFSAAAARPAFAALSRRAGLRCLGVRFCRLSAAGFKTLVDAEWPALTRLLAGAATHGADALGADAFAGFPALEELALASVRLGEAGVRLLASRRWPRLNRLELWAAPAAAGVAALARGTWPALEVLALGRDIFALRQLTLAEARRLAPALRELIVNW